VSNDATLRSVLRSTVSLVRGLLIGLGIAVGVWITAIIVLWAAGRRSVARELVTLIPNLLVLFRGLFGDARVSRGSKFLLGFAIVWLVSPVDLIPEFIPVAGPLDDAIVAALVLRYLLRHTDRSVLDQHWRGSATTLDVLAGRQQGAG
jgi:uncharacterized membrane protein YkvA (DUF1232 family)